MLYADYCRHCYHVIFAAKQAFNALPHEAAITYARGANDFNQSLSDFLRELAKRKNVGLPVGSVSGKG